MTPKEKHSIMCNMNTSDFNSMRKMLSEIEIKIMQLDPLKQREFYLPLQNFIYEAWFDANNPDDTFLYPKNI